MTTIDFFVPGMPGTKGSAKAFVVPGTSFANIVNDNPKTKNWAALVSKLAAEQMDGAAPWDGPVSVQLMFSLPRPKGHYLPATKKRPAPELRPDAPYRHTSKPDGDKMERATWDALTGIVFRDDSQIALWSGGKIYAEAPGVRIRVTRLPGGAP